LHPFHVKTKRFDEWLQVFFTRTQSTVKRNDRLKYILNKMKTVFWPPHPTFFSFNFINHLYIYLDNSYRMIEISVHGLSDQLQNNNVFINSNNISWGVVVFDYKQCNTSVRSYPRGRPKRFSIFFPCPYKPIQRHLFGLAPTSPTHLSLSRHTYI
jgi:hypothetical protein